MVDLSHMLDSDSDNDEESVEIERDPILNDIHFGADVTKMEN